MTRFPILVCSLLTSLVAAPVLADKVYRHVDENGVVHYTDQPPSKTSRPVELPPLQVVSPVALPEPAPSEAPRAAARRQDVAISVLSPAPDETFRGADRTLPVNVSLKPGLPEGYGLFYLLDGNPQNSEAVRASSYLLTGVERGQHMVTVVVVDPRGTEVARTQPVIVHMKPPTVNRPQ